MSISQLFRARDALLLRALKSGYPLYALLYLGIDCIVIDVVDLTLTRIIKSVVTGQTPVTLEWKNTPGEKHEPKVAYVMADAISCLSRKKYN